jgi:hypothetical protein
MDHPAMLYKNLLVGLKVIRLEYKHRDSTSFIIGKTFLSKVSLKTVKYLE